MSKEKDATKQEDKEVAIIAGSKAWIFICLGLEAKFAPAFINFS